MKKTTLTLITLTLLALSCNQTRRQPPIPSTLSEIPKQTAIIAYTDTVIDRHNVRIFEQDSAHVFHNDFGIGSKAVIYFNPAPVGGIRRKIFDGNGNLRRIVYTTNRPLHHDYFESDWDDRSIMFPYMDSIVEFLHNGDVRIGFEALRLRDTPFRFRSNLPNFSDYDSAGVLVRRRIFNFYNSTHSHIFEGWGDAHAAWENFHPNGNIKRRTIEGTAHAWTVAVGAIEWDSLGHKTSMSRIEESLPPGDEGGHFALRAIRTTTYFRPDGTIRKISRFSRSGEEAPECPCGYWQFFDEWGIEIDREEFAPCEDFAGDCDWEEDW